MSDGVKMVMRRILRDVQVELQDEFDKNFEREAFFSEAWARRKSPIRNEGRGLLQDTGRLRGSIRSRVTDDGIEFFTTEPYAGIHNEGGEIVVTARMKRFFRAKAYESAGSFGRKGSGGNGRGGTTAKGTRGPLSDRQFWGWMHSASLTAEAAFWCAMAMKKEGSVVRIPRRRFLGTSPEVERAVREIIEENLTEYFGQEFSLDGK